MIHFCCSKAVITIITKRPIILERKDGITT